jgi:tetratricopeptide (TPR) repeat protein
MGGSDFNVYLFGSSVPWGFPYAPNCDVGKIVAQTWSNSVNGCELVVRNEARYGAPSRYVLERTRSVAQHAHAPGRAIALVYSGNNEFIHLSPDRDKRGRGPMLVSAAERRSIVQSHRRHLEASVQMLRGAGIEVVLSTIPTNLRDWPPSYTVLTDERAEFFEDLYSRAADAGRAGRLDDAEHLLQDILGSDPEFAQAHFLLGRILLAAGRAEDARPHLVAANDFDGRPIRAISNVNKNIRALAAEHQIRLLDAEAAFQAAAADGICGSAQFWDDCHPKLAGYIQLADLLGAHIADFAGLDAAPAVASSDAVRDCHGMDQTFLAGVYARTGLYCYKHSDCWDSDPTLDLAESYLRDALNMAPGSIEVHIALTLVLARRGDDAGAQGFAGAAIRLDPERANWLLHGREARVTLGELGIVDVERWASGETNGPHPTH